MFVVQHSGAEVPAPLSVEESPGPRCCPRCTSTSLEIYRNPLQAQYIRCRCMELLGKGCVTLYVPHFCLDRRLEIRSAVVEASGVSTLLSWGSKLPKVGPTYRC